MQLTAVMLSPRERSWRFMVVVADSPCCPVGRELSVVQFEVVGEHEKSPPAGGL